MSENCEHESCHGHTLPANSSVVQTLDELEFERGIWQAAVDNDFERVKSLIETGTSVDIKDKSGYTALHYSSRAGNCKIVNYLLDNGADPNVQTKSGKESPLHRAAYQGHDEIVSLLLKRGANPLLQNSDGQTALHKAAAMNMKNVVYILTEHSPELIKIKDNKENIAIVR